VVAIAAISAASFIIFFVLFRPRWGAAEAPAPTAYSGA
jgi:hypothetical protein